MRLPHRTTEMARLYASFMIGGDLNLSAGGSVPVLAYECAPEDHQQSKARCSKPRFSLRTAVRRRRIVALPIAGQGTSHLVLGEGCDGSATQPHAERTSDARSRLVCQWTPLQRRSCDCLDNSSRRRLCSDERTRGELSDLGTNRSGNGSSNRPGSRLHSHRMLPTSPGNTPCEAGEI